MIKVNFTLKDKQLIKESYINFLINLKKFIETNTNNNDIITQFNILSYLFKNSYLTPEPTMLLDSKFENYLYIPIELSEGIQVMVGVCCCRHANELLNDILKLLNYDSKILYVYIDDKNDWYIKSNGCNCNHIAVYLTNNSEKIILDLYNDFVFTTDKLGNVININKTLNNNYREICHKYQDEKNIKTISKTLKKYYNLKSYGVTSIYDY